MIVKAAGGGGGRGMRVVHSDATLRPAVSLTRAEAMAAFGNDALYLEKYLEQPRHIEFQVMADQHGNVIHLGERDCSMQRRHQKVIEEAPAPGITTEMRERIGALCVEACRTIGYRGAGTIEFLFENNEFYFIEMNTRLQVEHPVTELITGVDLVKMQLMGRRRRAPERYAVGSEAARARGRVPYQRRKPKTFMPSPAPSACFILPAGRGYAWTRTSTRATRYRLTTTR